MKKDKQTKSFINDFKEYTPKKKEISKDAKDHTKIYDYLKKIAYRLDKFLVQNFSHVLESTLDIPKYYTKVVKLFDEFRNSNVEILSAIFKKLRDVIDPLNANINHAKRADPNLQNNKLQIITKLQSDMKTHQQSIIQLKDQNLKLKFVIKSQLDKAQQNRKKQNRMTQLLYILRKRNIDIDKIYEECCLTPSKKNSFENEDYDIDDEI